MIHVRGERVKALNRSEGVFTPPGQDTLVVPQAKVRYASLPTKFNKMATTPRLRLAQYAPQGDQGNKQCKISTSTQTKKTRVKRSSGVKLGKQYFYYSLDIRTNGVLEVDHRDRVTYFPLNGVDVIIPDGSGFVTRVPLDVTIRWDANRQKVLVNGKVLKSTKILGAGYYRRLHFDQKELNSLVKTQRRALFYTMDNDDKETVLRVLEQQLTNIDTQLGLLKQRGVSFSRDANVKRVYKFLKKQKDILNAYGSVLRKQGRQISKWKRVRKRFLPGFRVKLSALEKQHRTLRSQYNRVKKQLSGILYRYWYRYRKRHSKPCP